MRKFVDGMMAGEREKERKRKQTAQNEEKDIDSEEGEETYMYDVRKPMAFINEGEHGVFDITKQTGLNTAKSVFDKGSIFKT
jgi:hypothetical protein